MSAKTPRIDFAVLRRNCDGFTADNIPTAFRILAAGENQTDKGPLVYTPDSARMVAEAFARRGNPLAIYYEHEDQLPLEKRGGAPMKGACAAPSADLDAAHGDPAALECWAQAVDWTEEAKRQIKAGERRQISPVAAFDKETREVVEILNVSLCSEGATHFGTLLASRSGRDTSNMDDMIQKLLDACNAGEWEEAENIVQQMESAEGGEGYGKMARGLMAKMAKAAPPPPPPMPKPVDDQTATKRLAAARPALLAGDIDAFTRERADGLAATREAREAARESRRETVNLKLSRARDEGLLGPDGDPVTEREHVAAADPVATEKFIAHLRRSAKTGVLTLAKPGTTTEASPGGKKPGTVDATFGLTEIEQVTAKQNGVSLEAFARSKERVNVRTTVEPGRA